MIVLPYLHQKMSVTDVVIALDLRVELAVARKLPDMFRGGPKGRYDFGTYCFPISKLSLSVDEVHATSIQDYISDNLVLKISVATRSDRTSDKHFFVRLKPGPHLHFG